MSESKPAAKQSSSSSGNSSGNRQVEKRLTDDEKAAAEAVVIPEFEAELRAAHSRADVDDIEDASKRYTQERHKRAKSAKS